MEGGKNKLLSSRVHSHDFFLAFSNLVQHWITVSMVIENAVKGSIHPIIDVIHQSLVVFLCRRVYG